MAGEALATLREALETSGRTGETWFDSELHRRTGEMLLTRPQPDAGVAERELLQAIGISRRQSARLFELRAATGLARLWAAQGRFNEARDLLAPLCAWFTGDLDTAGLNEARTLLDGLAGS